MPETDNEFMCLKLSFSKFFFYTLYAWNDLTITSNVQCYFLRFFPSLIEMIEGLFN